MRWPTPTLGQIATITGGSTPSRTQEEYWNGSILWLTPTDLPMPGKGIADVSDTAGKITEEGLAAISAQLLPVGTVLFSSRATIGKLGISRVPLATNQGFANFIPKNFVDAKYLAYCLLHYTAEITALAGSTTFKEVTKTALKKFKIPLPALSEQRRIVEILDQADQLRKKRAEADAKAARILPALFYKMFGDPATNPKGWPVHPFSKLFFQDKAAVDESSGKHLPYLGLEHIESESGRILSSEAEGLSVKVRGLAFRFGPQHVLYGKLRPYLNKVALPSFEGRCSTELVPLMPKPGVLREFVAAYLRLPYIVNAAMTTNKGARMPRTDMHLLLEMKVPIPDIGIQNIFAMTYSAVSRTTVSNQKVGSRIENLFSVLLHRAFTGNLTAKWREAHMKELLAEMEQQAKVLNVRIES